MDEVDREQIIDLINLTVKNHIDHEGAMCTSYVLITEWVDSKGDYYTFTVCDENSPPWRHEGLVQYALSNEIYPTEEEGGEE